MTFMGCFFVLFPNKKPPLCTGNSSKLEILFNIQNAQDIQKCIFLDYITLKMLFCIFAMFSSRKSLEKSIFHCPVRSANWIMYLVLEDSLYMHIAITCNSSEWMRNIKQVHFFLLMNLYSLEIIIRMFLWLIFFVLYWQIFQWVNCLHVFVVPVSGNIFEWIRRTKKSIVHPTNSLFFFWTCVFLFRNLILFTFIWFGYTNWTNKSSATPYFIQHCTHNC